MGTWNKLESGITPVDNKIEFDTESLGKFALKVTEGRLPSEYQEVEYIKHERGTGSYINTNYQFGNGLTIVAEYKADNFSKSSPMRFIGCITSDFNYGLLAQAYTASVTLVNGRGWSYQDGASVTAGSWNTFTIRNLPNNQVSILNDTTLRTVTTYGAVSSSLPVYIFVNNRGGNKDYDGGDVADIYFKSVKIYATDNTLALDLVPCKNKSTDEVGMYDIVNSTFYGNSGSGSFVAGPDVN